MADASGGRGAPPRLPMLELPAQQASLWEPPPQQAASGRPAPVRSPRPPKPPWYRTAWFVSLVIVVVFGAAGWILGSQLA
jgi:hypothetical protein